MSKHFKNVATKAFAVAFAGGLSLNGFALAAGASARTAKSARATSGVVALPAPSPNPAQPMGNPAKDNMSMSVGAGQALRPAGIRRRSRSISMSSTPTFATF
jgi:hypothetical protein